MSAFLRKYATGTGADVCIPIVKRGVVDFAVSADWAPAAGDVTVSIDGGVAANIGTLPVAITKGNSATWKFVFTNAELTGKRITVTVADAATKAVEDQQFNIETYGNASAQHPFDLGTASIAQTGDSYARIGANGAGLTAVALSTAGIQAIWDALTSALTTVGSIGKLLVDNINATISSRLAGASYTAPLDAAGVRSAVGLASANLDTQLAALPTASEINAEVVDALTTDTYAEPSGAPGATVSLKDKIGFIYQALRNKLTITSSAKTFHNDAGTAQWSKSLSDDGSTYTEAEGS